MNPRKESDPKDMLLSSSATTITRINLKEQKKVMDNLRSFRAYDFTERFSTKAVTYRKPCFQTTMYLCFIQNLLQTSLHSEQASNTIAQR